ncbi:MAG TPA: MoaD/ThiS family protein [Xanthomonadales bacterium]|nr:MoaD/ThiS family protein [Xanthomonadales bacterium]
MPRIVLASQLARWLPDASEQRDFVIAVRGATLGEALRDAFAQHPALRGYVVDEHGVVRHHVAVFVDGTSIRDKRALDDALRDDSEIHVMQALSGG